MEKTNNFHQFKNYSNSVSHVVGWGSQYSENNISLFGIKNMSKNTYVKEKNIIKNKEYYYGAYSRYFSDIMGGSVRNTSILFGRSNDSSRQKK